MQNVNRIISYIESHGFRAEFNDQSQDISIFIPVATNGKYIGDEEIKVSNFEETRIALGY